MTTRKNNKSSGQKKQIGPEDRHLKGFENEDFDVWKPDFRIEEVKLKGKHG
jgi:hypothetical protein